MGLLTTIAFGAVIVISAIVIFGILYLSIEIQKKITARRLKYLIKNEKRFDGAAMGTVHTKEGKSVKVDILKAGEENRFAELTVTGKSTAFTLRNGRKLKV